MNEIKFQKYFNLVFYCHFIDVLFVYFMVEQ